MQVPVKFSIIIPTYKRPEGLLAATRSVISQNYSNFELIIINDSPQFDYDIFEKDTIFSDFRDKRSIFYIKNVENKGNNFCKNLALGQVATDSEYVLFLDDDDFLAPNALAELNACLLNNNRPAWLVTNRCVVSQDSLMNFTITQVLTTNHTRKVCVSYFVDYLLRKRFNGDATHVVRTSIAKKATFSLRIKNGEEWYYFLQLPKRFLYKNLNTTYTTSGYLQGGLTDVLKTQYTSNTSLLWKDDWKNYKYLIYMFIRTIYQTFK